jgi:hypothetical protein
MGKAQADDLEFRPGWAGLKDRAAYGLMAFQFLRQSPRSKNSKRSEVHSAKF